MKKNRTTRFAIIGSILCATFISACTTSSNDCCDNDLKLVIYYGFGDSTKVISNNTNQNEIDSTMKSIDWKDFHMVCLEESNGNTLDVGGSLFEDGFSSGYMNVSENNNLILRSPIPSGVNDMIETLKTFCISKNDWEEKYHYQ